ncbi:MAG: hypothetical protein ABEJ99_02885 [Candidatus Nanohaloarchaea archaeon]
MPQAKPVDFGEEFDILDGKGTKEVRLEPVEVLGNEIPALDFDTTIQHLDRNGYHVEVHPNGGSADVEAWTDIKEFDISALRDDAVQVRFSMDMDEVNRRRMERGYDPVDNPETYVGKVYDQIVGELVEREKKLERASENYVDSIFESDDDPVERLEAEFRRLGDKSHDIVERYTGDMRMSDLIMNYAVHFELHPGETIDNERRNLEGKMPLHYALKDDSLEDRNNLYLERYLEKVLEKAGEREELSPALKGYWQDLN